MGVASGDPKPGPRPEPAVPPGTGGIHLHDFTPDGFEWLDCQSANDSVLSFLRKGRSAQDTLVVCCNFTPVVRKDHRVGVPQGGWYQEIFNSDSQHYAGSNVGNYPGTMADSTEWHGRPWSIKMTLPPLAIAVFKPGA